MDPTTPLVSKTPNPKYKYQYPISTYNEVVRMHNNLLPSEPNLILLLHCRPYMYIYQAISTPLGILALLLLLFVPVVNLLIFSSLLFCLCFVNWQCQTHSKNKSIVSDPFKNFFLEDDLCEKLEKHHITLKLSVKELQGFTFNRHINQELLSRSKDNRVQFTIYDNHMHDCYYEFPRERIRLGWCLLVSALLTCFALYLELQLFVLH